jgi:uncharacterized repeat protein (TIGR03803 family)
MKCLKLIGISSVIAVISTVEPARADWTPAEASVTPPAVLSLDAFAETGGKGAHPNGPLVVAPDGALYGSTFSGGTNGIGTLFRLTTGGAFTDRYDFPSAQGGPGPLVAGPHGALFCAGVDSTSGGGEDGGSEPTLFRLATDGTANPFYYFPNPAGSLAGMLLGPDGALYGLYTPPGAAIFYYPFVFRMASDGTVTNLHYFVGTSGSNDSEPTGLVVGPDAALYGSTYNGGAGNKGTLYRLTTDGAFTKLHDFNGPDGSGPGAVLAGPDGALYGSTSLGGTSNNGTLFRLTTGGSFTKLHDFNMTADSYQTVFLVSGPAGALYGSTYAGGTNNKGTLFRLTTDGAFTKLHDFNGTDGAAPSAAMVVGPDGTLYGSTYSGGTSNRGTLFRLSPGGTFTKLHDFVGTDGSGPDSVLVAGPDGALYGTTREGGPHGGGIIFKLLLDRPPVISIAQSNAFMIISWSMTSVNFQLQESTDLSLPNSWSSVPQLPATNASRVSVTLPANGQGKFFRLKSQ